MREAYAIFVDVAKIIYFSILGVMIFFTLVSLYGGYRYFRDSGLNISCNGYTKNQIDSGNAPLICYQ